MAGTLKLRHEYVLSTEIRELGSHPETGPP